MVRGRFWSLFTVAVAIAAMMEGEWKVQAQVTLLQPIDIGAGLKSGRFSADYAPMFVGDSLKPFDGNPYTEAAILSGDTFTVTLRLDSLRSVEKTKVFFWAAGEWSVEVADSVADLDSRSRSFSVLVDWRSNPAFAWDSASVAPKRIGAARLRTRAAPGTGIYLGEWGLEGSVTFTKLAIIPYPPRVMPGATLHLDVRMIDTGGEIYPYLLPDRLVWTSSNANAAVVDEDGNLLGVALGSSLITVATITNTISGAAVATVESYVKPAKVSPMTIKVALVLQDPVLLNANRIHEEFGWRDPRVLSDDLVRHFREATDSVINFQFVEVIDAAVLFTKMYGKYLTVSQYVQLLKEPNWTTLKAASAVDSIKFQYTDFVKSYNFDVKRNNGEIDEVWVFTGPYLGMYESQLMGPNAFWWNSPPIRDGTALTKLLSVMGLNYERGVDQAFHSFGHRSESAMTEAYRLATGQPWSPNSPTPTPWDLFTRFDKTSPGKANVGNIHFPPNGTRDYDYGNPALVTSYAENWYHYPYLYSASSQVNISTWYYTPGDPLAEGNDHLGYLRWWYGHLPRYQGVTGGVLNNWWHYITDFEAAVALAQRTPALAVPNDEGSPPRGFFLNQNYPNPFNPSTTIEFYVDRRSAVTLQVFSLLGQSVGTIMRGEVDAGIHRVTFDASRLATGIYLYRLVTPEGVSVRKMLLVR